MKPKELIKQTEKNIKRTKTKDKRRMKLKTLKNLKRKQSEMVDFDFECVLPEELKQEAIKWIKEKGFYHECGIKWSEEVIKWIKHFFNITEEDLDLPVTNCSLNKEGDKLI